MSITALRLVLGDQLSFDLSVLDGLDPVHDRVLLAEVADEANHVPHHPQKIAFIFSAMRHFAQALRERGVAVDYVALDDPANSGSLAGELARFAAKYRPADIHVTEAGDWRVEQALKSSGLPITWHADQRFLCSRAQFACWASGKKQLRMEFFYREMRRRAGLLLNLDGTPEGGVWNLDAEAYRQGRVALNAAEGFIRQLIGWREYVRGIYWLQMPDYARRNAFGNTRPLPEFYWTGQTRMNCMRQVIGQTLDHAYAHHIQRLMVTGNFALLAGIAPPALCDWYLAVYMDAFDWVELPNVLGMVLHADGGYLGSKPYCASGQYIKRMSDYCHGCAYKVGESTTDDACPFNALYWHFLMRHRERLQSNPRMTMIYRNLARMDESKREGVWQRGEALLERLDAGDAL